MSERSEDSGLGLTLIGGGVALELNPLVTEGASLSIKVLATGRIDGVLLELEEVFDLYNALGKIIIDQTQGKEKR